MHICWVDPLRVAVTIKDCLGILGSCYVLFRGVLLC